MKRDKTALRKLCKNEYAYHRGTSNLRDHLTCAHPLKLRLPEGHSSLDSYLSQAECPEGHAKRITDHIADMVVCNICPATLVEKAGFGALLNFIKLGYRMLSAIHITEIARRKFSNGKLATKDYLQAKVDFFAFTTDYMDQ